MAGGISPEPPEELKLPCPISEPGFDTRSGTKISSLVGIEIVHFQSR
jgi:hypothetical protein